MTVSTSAIQRQKLVRYAAAVTRGPAELLDFVIPLWAGVVLSASAFEVGALVAVELAVSVIARPLAGRLADTFERRTVAAVGAFLYGIGCAAYILAGAGGGIGIAFASAAVTGIGGSLAWVSLRAIVSEKYESDRSAYAALMSAEETGSWVSFVVGLSALGWIGFTGLFVLAALSCIAGAVILLVTPSTQQRDPHADKHAVRGMHRTLRPVFIAVVLSMTAEAAIGILLLLHLQRQFHLDIITIAWVFLPGAIALAVLPGPMHHVVVKIGRGRAVVLAGLLSAAFAVALGFAPTPVVIGALWLLSAAAWAVVIPLEQAVVAEIGHGMAGRAMGAYEAFALLGGAIGAVLGGAAYELGSWTLACFIAACIALIGGFAAFVALRATGTLEVPEPVASSVEGSS